MGYNLNEITNLIKQEQGTAVNIKSKATRKNVLSALEKIAQRLKLFKQTPEEGLALFCGNTSEKEGQSDIQIWEVHPLEPIKSRLYRCDQAFVLDPLKDQIREKEIYGLVAIDTSEASIAFLKGKSISVFKNMKSLVPGKQIHGGQCLVDGTLVMLNNGEIKRIEELHNPLSVVSADFNNYSIENSPITDKWDVQKNKVYKIFTKNPRVDIESSGEHKFFIWDNEIKEIKARDLKEGQYLLMPEKIDIKGEEQKLNPHNYYTTITLKEGTRNLIKKRRLEKKLFQRELARKIRKHQTVISRIELGKIPVDTNIVKKVCNYLNINFDGISEDIISDNKIKLPNEIDKNLAQMIGYFAGDGSYEPARISFHEQDYNVIQKYKKLIEKTIKRNSSLVFRESKNYYLLRVYSRSLVKLLKNEFPEIKSSMKTGIPSKILKSKDEILAAFLRGFFDAEGYVSGGRIGLGINNKELANQTRLALLRFGIISSVLIYDNKRNKYSNNLRYTVEISEIKSLGLFRETIGFTFKNKNEKLDAFISNRSNTNYIRQVLISGKEVKKEFNKFGLEGKTFPKVSKFFDNKRMMSKGIYEHSILDCIKENKELYGKLKKPLERELIPVKIKKIEVNKKRARMTDISTRNQNFVANGLVVHNSAARFSRVRQGLLLTFEKQVGEIATKAFEEEKDLKGIIVGGPGIIKDEFVKGDFLSEALKKKIIGIKDLGYSGEEGLEELVTRSQDILEEAAVMHEKVLLQNFFEHLQKDNGLAVYGYNEVEKALDVGAVETLIISEEFKLKGSEIEEKVILKGLEDKAEKIDADFQIVSKETAEGSQFLQLGGIGAVLRFKID